VRKSAIAAPETRAAHSAMAARTRLSMSSVYDAGRATQRNDHRFAPIPPRVVAFLT